MNQKDAAREQLEDVLKRIHDICRDGTLLPEVKLLEIYHEATKPLDARKHFLSDMRTGRKQS